MQRPDWVPESIDLERPSVARMYDYFLGGSHNFAVDREAARKVIAADDVDPVQSVYRHADNSLHPRGRAELACFFDGFELVQPGLVWVPQWRPGAPDQVDDADQAVFVCGVGQLRA